MTQLKARGTVLDVVSEFPCGYVRASQASDVEPLRKLINLRAYLSGDFDDALRFKYWAAGLATFRCLDRVGGSSARPCPQHLVFIRSAPRWRPSPAASARRSRSPARCCGTPRSSSSTSRPPRSASPRPSRCSRWCAGWPTTASAWCLISHNLNDVFQVADDIAVLYLGQMVAPGARPRTSPTNQVVELITDRPSGDRGTRAQPHRRTADGSDEHRHRARTRLGSRARRPGEPSAPRRRLRRQDPRAATSGRCPASLGLVVLVIVFTILRPDTFTKAFNFANLIQQGAGRHGPRDGPGLRAAARRDRPVGRLHRRHGAAVIGVLLTTARLALAARRSSSGC